MKNLLDLKIADFMGDLKSQVQKNLAAFADRQAELFRATLIAQAPAENVLPKYRRSIKIRRNPSGSRSVVSSYKGFARKLNDKSLVVLVFSPVNKKASESKTFLFLKAFEPWTLRKIPFALNKAEVKISYRKVRPEEFAGVEDRLNRILADKTTLGFVGIKPSRTSLNAEVEAEEDFAFTLLRVERAGDRSFKRHWLPALDLNRAQVRNHLRRYDAHGFLMAEEQPQDLPLQSPGDYADQRAFMKKLL